MSKEKIEIKFIKVHPDAQLPKQNHSGLMTGDTGFDLFSVETVTIPASDSKVIPVGIKVGYITPGYWFKIEARSGLGFKHGLEPHPGIIDNQYRGDCGIKLFNFSPIPVTLKAGDRIAQLVVYELIQPVISWTEEVNETERGELGFGSSDEKQK